MMVLLSPSYNNVGSLSCHFLWLLLCLQRPGLSSCFSISMDSNNIQRLSTSSSANQQVPSSKYIVSPRNESFPIKLLLEQGAGCQEQEVEKVNHTSQIKDSGGRRRRGQPWDFYYNLLLMYNAEHGHCVIPQTYVTPDGVKMGIWVMNERKRLNPFVDDKGKVIVGTDKAIQTQIRQLNDIGFVWEVNDLMWEDHFNLLLAYKNEFQHLHVPYSYVTPNGIKLGIFVNNQRAELKRLMDKDGKVKVGTDKAIQRRIHQLNDIGFVWDTRDLIWEQNFNLLLAYNEEHGHCAIPYKYITPADGVKIGMWVSNQRRRLKPFLDTDGKVKAGTDKDIQRRIHQLNDIGFVWDATFKNEEWEDHFELLLAYKNEFQHLRIPKRYVTPNGVRLGLWVMNQRAELKPFIDTDGKVKAGTDKSRGQRIDRLNAIGFVWEVGSGRPISVGTTSSRAVI